MSQRSHIHLLLDTQFVILFRENFGHVQATPCSCRNLGECWMDSLDCEFWWPDQRSIAAADKNKTQKSYYIHFHWFLFSALWLHHSTGLVPGIGRGQVWGYRKCWLDDSSVGVYSEGAEWTLGDCLYLQSKYDCFQIIHCREWTRDMNTMSMKRLKNKREWSNRPCRVRFFH